MKKIPTLFKREFKDHKVVGILPEFTNEICKEAFFKGVPTIKYDGTEFGIREFADEGVIYFIDSDIEGIDFEAVNNEVDFYFTKDNPLIRIEGV